MGVDVLFEARERELFGLFDSCHQNKAGSSLSGCAFLSFVTLCWPSISGDSHLGSVPKRIGLAQ